EAQLAQVVKIQFQTAGKLYDFGTAGITVQKGDKVIVETERGRSIGTVVKGPVDIEDKDIPDGFKSILRKAEQEDLQAAAGNAAKEKEAFNFCLVRIKERGMEMKLVKVEYLFDGSKAIFYFTADGRIDFRELVKDLAHAFHTRIEMRQIGVRDESGMVGGLGVCGRELCCASFLREFEPVSVKMAKEQNLALNPSKISGQCGRLLCCLGYEYETYCSLKKCLPKCGKRVHCGDAAGEVVRLNILEGTVTIRTDDNHEVVVRGEDIKPENISDRAERPKKQLKDGEGRQKSDEKPEQEQPSGPRRHRNHIKLKETRKKEKP
ncbi:MAG TPA: stage 0 sporulation family protein, partial [Geobacteraceae bacterium]|nr:stage 0 sporulation family protein [Geobacteraceae bacterium]